MRTSLKSLLTPACLCGLLLVPGVARASSFAAIPASQDASISTLQPATNFGTAPTLAVGGGSVALVQFDLGVLPAGITAADLLSAKLVVFAGSVTSPGALDLFSATSSWTEGTVTANSAPTVGAAVTAGVPVAGAMTSVVFDVTTEVQVWVTTPSVNHGLRVSAASSAPGTAVSLDSKENATTRQQPLLLVQLKDRLAVTLPAIADTFISSGAPANNFGADPVLSVGNGIASLVRFDLSPVPAWTIAADVLKAVVFGFVDTVSAAGAFDVRLASSPWTESSVTYSNSPSVGLTILTSVPVPALYQVVSLDASSALQGWVTNPATNFGLQLSLSATTPGAQFGFDSRENTATGHPPFLLAWISETGLATLGPSQLAANGGGSQSAAVSTAFAAPLSVLVTDANAVPVSGWPVTFSPPGSGASASLRSVTVLTNASGVASVLPTANATPGSYSVTAAAGGVTGSVSFSLTNLGPATHFAVTAPASAAAGAAFAFTGTALDAGGSTAAGYAGTVHFTSGDPGATLPANATLTNGTGSFSATLRRAGTQSLTATDTVNAAITGSASVLVPAETSVPALGGAGLAGFAAFLTAAGLVLLRRSGPVG